MTTSPALLELSDVRVLYQRSIVGIQSVSLSVRQNEIVAIVGANGAGKTTTLRAISGFIALDNARVAGGTIRYKGLDLANKAPDFVARHGVTLIPEREKIFPNLTVQENLEAIHARHSSAAEQARLKALVLTYFPRLAELRRKEAGLLSGGERQMLAISAAICCAPDLLLVDELSLGLAPVIVDELAERLLEIRKELGISILLVEQSASFALRLADYVFVLENGAVSLKGTPAALGANDAIRRSYLGGSEASRINYRAEAERRLAGGPA